MPIFQYRGYRPDGSEVAGTIEAASQKDAALRLKETGLYPRSVEGVSKRRFSLYNRQDTTLLPSVTRQLSTLLSSGVPLLEALRSLSDEQKGFWKTMLVDIRERIASGSGFSKTLEEYPGIFPEFYINMVAAGEASGNLDNILVRIADFLEAQENLRSKVRTSMVYPVFMICISFIVLSFLFTFVMPKITRIYQDTQSALPLLTVVLIRVSDMFQRFWWLLMGFLIGGLYSLRELREKKRDFLDRILLRIPGNILRSLYFGRFTRTLGFLLEGGLPMLNALELSAKSIGNRVIRTHVLEAGKRVSEGARLSASLDGFPPVLLQLIATGERSGQLAEVLKNAARSYEEEFSRRVDRALSLLEPAMILCMGFLVGLIVLAVLLPIFQLNQLIK